MKKIIIVLVFLSTQAMGYTKKDIMGVWKLTQFYSIDQDGNKESWCYGVNGYIAYFPKFMTVGINCDSIQPGSGAEKIGGLLFYSGPYQMNSKTNEVIHKVRNFSHESLHKDYKRKVSMKGRNKLRLTGSLGDGKKVIVEWVRVESFKRATNKVVGEWDLVGSKNRVPGTDKTIPFCNGFYGNIFFTPGGYTAVSINCGKKKNPEEPADQFGRKYFYFGKYKVKGSLVTQFPLNASEVDHIKVPAKREMEFKKDLLFLKGTNGSDFVAVWKKF